MARVQCGHQRTTNFRIDLRRFELRKRTHADGPAHTVDEHVDAAEPLRRKRHRRSSALVGLQIRDEAGRARLGRMRCDFRNEIGAIDQDDFAAFGSHTQRDTPTDTLRRARHDHHFACESLHGHTAPALALGVNFS
jgi:hypothetical protein